MALGMEGNMQDSRRSSVPQITDHRVEVRDRGLRGKAERPLRSQTWQSVEGCGEDPGL